MELYSHQLKAVDKMHNGCILCGEVGTGKSRTAILYFYTRVCGGNIEANGEGFWGEPTTPRDLYIITTAKKRDSLDWTIECAQFGLSDDRDISASRIKVTVDSWNNIKKYKNITNAFFIFDEQRVKGWGAWSKTFVRIAHLNQWVLLSATPGDTWKDYIPVFIANGFYTCKSDFDRKHANFVPYLNFPKYQDTWRDEDILRSQRNRILVIMRYKKLTIPHHLDVWCSYDRKLYSKVVKDRWNPYTDEPIENVGEYCYLMRKVANNDLSRVVEVYNILKNTPKAIIFYNFDYELERIKTNLTGAVIWNQEVAIAEWNGHKHEPVPNTDRWVYLVQYNSGAEGWNCIETDTIIFYSQNYSYSMTHQSAGRIDRLNTPFTHLYYYHLRSHAPIDEAIARALRQKEDFNEKAFIRF